MRLWADPVEEWKSRFTTWSGEPARPRQVPSINSLPIIVGSAITPDLLNDFHGARVLVYRYVDIYEADNVTPWRTNVGITDGSVNIDIGRAERRQLDLTIADTTIDYGPGGLWYDKIIKPFVGIVTDDAIWVTCLGEFLIDNAERPYFPDLIHITGRDFVKKLMLDKIATTVTFNAGYNIASLIQSLAASAGITKFNLTATSETTDVSYDFERGSDRWKIVNDIAAAYGLELFFDAFGYLTLRPQVDPYTAPLSHDFLTGTGGNISNYSRKTSDTRLFNDVIVYGDAQKNPLVYGRAENTDVDSPTRIAAIGRRTWTYTSAMIENNTQAATVASAFLSVSALEQYDVSIDALAAPWLEGGSAVRFVAPDAAVDEPDKYLLTSFTIPFGLGVMPTVCKRVHIVG